MGGINLTDKMQTSAIMTAGMRALIESIGLIETEIFIANIKREHFDYTEWRENLYEDITLDELLSNASSYMREHPELIPKNAKIYRR